MLAFRLSFKQIQVSVKYMYQIVFTYKRDFNVILVPYDKY